MHRVCQTAVTATPRVCSVVWSRDRIFFNISVGTGSVLSRCRSEGMWCDAALIMMARKSFSVFFFIFSSCLLSLYCIGPSFLFQFDAGTKLYRVDSDVHL